MRGFVVATALTVLLFSNARMVSAQDVVSVLLAAPAGIEMIGEYLGVIESLDSKFERLLDADLKTAVSLFEQAKASPNKSAELIRSARIYYTRAAEIQADSMDEERRHKRAIALLGLFACCKAELDHPNAERALKKISEIPAGKSLALRLKYEAQRPSNLLHMYVPAQIFQKKLTDKDYREFSPAFDGLLSIQESVNKKLAKIAQEGGKTKP